MRGVFSPLLLALKVGTSWSRNSGNFKRNLLSVFWFLFILCFWWLVCLTVSAGVLWSPPACIRPPWHQGSEGQASPSLTLWASGLSAEQFQYRKCISIKNRYIFKRCMELHRYTINLTYEMMDKEEKHQWIAHSNLQLLCISKDWVFFFSS